MKPIKLCKGLTLTKGEDGHWLHFLGANRVASVCLEHLSKGRVISGAIKDWAEDTIKRRG